MLLRTLLLMMMLATVPALCQTDNVIANGGFEQVNDATPGADGLVSGWKLADPPRVPVGWSLNTAYPGELAIAEEAPFEGKRCARVTSAPGTSAHLFQMCTGLVADKWYRVRVMARGGAFNVHFYEYYQNAPIGGTLAMQATGAREEWREFQGFYQPQGAGYLRSALALFPAGGQTVDFDNVVLEPLALPEIPADAPSIVYENDLARIEIAASGHLKSLAPKASEENYAAGPTPFPIFSAVRNGVTSPAHLLTQEGDVLRVQFLDPELKASFRVTPRKQHFLIEVLSVEPEDVEALHVEFPVKRLEKVGGAFNATYDDEFGACMFGTTVNVQNIPTSRGSDTRSLRSACYREHGMVGAGFALVCAPGDQFKPAIMEAEQQNGLPCPILEGEWAMDSVPAGKSYLFGTGVIESDIDTLIRYAKIGGFGTIIFLKSDWLANHGHYDINKSNFPDGIESVKRAVQKIHDAGLDAGVHIFGPTISPNDPYVTPIPDDRLAFVKCPPLAEAVDAATTTITLTEQPNLPPKTARSQAFPNYYLRVGDEIIRYTDAVQIGETFSFLNCQRGSLGTTAAAHPAGAEVKGLLAMWGFLLMDPDSTLVEEVTEKFADVFNECGFDMVYFDASDGILPDYLDRWYYLNKLHLAHYKAFGRDVLYQTSNGTGSDILWHIVPRSASADGHGDIKGYLDDRWPGILNMGNNFTRADIGWYYWFRECRPDQIEYVCARALGVDGSISVETSREAMDRLSQSRQMFEMIGRWERCRAQGYFGEDVKEKLREPKKDFRLFDAGGGDWRLYRAAYEAPRAVDVLDGEQNVWKITNDQDAPCTLGIEIVRGTRSVGKAEYDGGLVIEPFDTATQYELSETNQYAKYVIGGTKKVTAKGAARADVTQDFALSTDGAKAGGSCMVYSAQNSGPPNGWGGIGRRFDEPLDLSNHGGLGLWLHGDANHETVRIQLRDTAGQSIDFLPVINFSGWRLFTFPFPEKPACDVAKIEYLLFYFNNISPNSSVRVMFDDVRALRGVPEPTALHDPVIKIGDQELRFSVDLPPGKALTCDADTGAEFWPGGMEEGQPVDAETQLLKLAPGENTVTLSCAAEDDFPGDVEVLLYRMWPVEE